MTDINRNQGGVNYQRVIQIRRSLHPVNPEQMHEIIKTAGCSTRFADDGMAFFTHTVGRCEYPLNPCGAHSRKWVEQACADQGFHRPCDIAALLVGAQVIATSNAIADAFERSPAATAAPSDNLRALMEEIDLVVPQHTSFTESGFGFAGGAQ